MHMTNSRRHTIAICIALAISLFVSTNVLAQDIARDAVNYLRPISQDAGVAETTVERTVGEVVRLILSVAGLFFFVLMIYAGIRWMLARGEESQIADARKTLVAAVIGLIIMVSSYAISIAVTEGILGNLRDGGVGSVEVAEGEFGEIGCCNVKLQNKNDELFRLDPAFWVNYMSIESECLGHVPAEPDQIIKEGPEWIPGIDDRECRLRTQGR